MAESAQSLLTRLGMSPVEVTLATSWLVGKTPRTSHPDAEGTRVIVRGAQKLLNQLGYHLGVDGFMGPKTEQAMDSVLGRGWSDQLWIKLYYRLSGAAQGRRGTVPYVALGDMPSIGAGTALILAGAGYWLLMKWAAK